MKNKIEILLYGYSILDNQRIDYGLHNDELLAVRRGDEHC